MVSYLLSEVDFPHGDICSCSSEMSWVRRFALSALGRSGCFAAGGALGIAELILPEFPDWPESRVVLGNTDEDEIYFATNSPYHFDILFGEKPPPVPATGVGTLILPANASASVSLPAVVLAHGSGGIEPGGEMRAGQMLAAAELAKPALAGPSISLEVCNGPA